jgi:PTS system mannitol-specific IIC component
MINYLLPVLIGFTGGYMVHKTRGGVVGATATMGVIVGADIPMFLGAMIMGPLGGWLMKKIDERLEERIPIGFEMLVNNFSAGILAVVLALLGNLIIGPIVTSISDAAGSLVDAMVNARLLPLAAIIIEPAKVLFLNNALKSRRTGPVRGCCCRRNWPRPALSAGNQSWSGSGLCSSLTTWRAKGCSKNLRPAR